MKNHEPETAKNQAPAEPPILCYPQLLAEVGCYLYGEVSWQRQLAEALQHPNLPYRGVDVPTLKKWVSSSKSRRGVPWWVAAELLRLVREARIERTKQEQIILEGLAKCR